MQVECNKQVMFGPDPKPVFIRLPFIGDRAASFAQRSLRQCFKSFPAAKPLLIFKTQRIPNSSPKDRLPVQLQHNVIYSFACTCSCRYVGRTERRLEDRISEHVPKWLSNDPKKPPRSKRSPDSAVTRHLQVCTCSFDSARRNFKVLFSAAHTNALRILEAITIKRLSPDLCIQKEHVLALALPW